MNNPPAKVLIVDDELQNRKLLEALLLPEGYITLTACSGQEALDMVSRQPPDLILLDLMMPDMDGFQVTQTLKAAPESANIPIILVTASADRTSRLAGLSAGAEDFLNKPVERAELWLRVRNLLRLKRLSDLVKNHSCNLELEVQARTASLSESERRFSDMLRNVKLAAVMLDLEGRVTFCNDYLLSLVGRIREDVVGQNWFKLFIPAKNGSAKDDFTKLLGNAADAWHRESEIVTRAGEARLMRWNNSLLRSNSGEVIGSASLGEDITEHRQSEIRVQSLNRVYALHSCINALIVRVTSQDELLKEACRIAVEEGGFETSFIGMVDEATHNVVLAASAGKDEALLSAVQNWLSSGDSAPSTTVMSAIREGRALVSNDVRRDKNVLRGNIYAEAGVHSLAVLPLLVADTAVGTFVLCSSTLEFFHDEEMELLNELAANVAFAIDHIRKADRLNYLAYYDALTGLSNRTLFLDRIAQYLRRRAGTGAILSMVMLDLERFKQLNDKHGRSIGDTVLTWVAARLTSTLGDAELLARVGGDQFAFVVSEERGEGNVVRFLERLSDALTQDPLIIDGTLIRIAAKSGIATFPDDGTHAEALLRNAEVALKLAKSSGDRFSYFSSELNALALRRIALEEMLKTAVGAQQFVLHYQPKVDMISGELVGAEALIRWQHPECGLLSPAEFIGIAEETGLIVPIGSWVIQTVCSQQAEWVKAGLRPVPISINLSPVQFKIGDILQTVRDALAIHSIDGNLLGLELTESQMMNESTSAVKTLQALRKLGLGLALDDFGTGYSSLAYLKRFPFDSVKIDMSFITDITHSAEDAAIATAIIALAHSLGLKVLAEGIETLGQFNYLRAQGCDQMQGYFFSPAVEKDVFESDLRSKKRMITLASTGGDERTLLLVDDEPLISAALTRMLRHEGYRILTATSGSKGLEALSINAIQVIISDQRMPEMSGTEFLSTVKQMYPDTIRIILSGYTDLDVVTESVNRGAVFKFLTKPWDDDLLREHVRDAFRRYRPSTPRARLLHSPSL